MSLGTNLAKDAGDSLIGTRAVPTLAAFAGSSGMVTVTIPSTLALGTYYVVTCADDLAAVTETVESDNCTAAGPVTVTRPDLGGDVGHDDSQRPCRGAGGHVLRDGHRAEHRRGGVGAVDEPLRIPATHC